MQDKILLSTLIYVSILHDLDEALESKGWKQAMDEEMEALKKNETRELMPITQGKKEIDGYILSNFISQRLKARLVAKRYAQSFEIDYIETFIPVANFNTVRMLIALAAKCEWNILLFDVKNAFLHGELKTALYGLKQSPRAWFG